MNSSFVAINFFHVLAIVTSSFADKNDAQNPITFTEADYQMIEQMYKTPQLYNQMAESICPTVFGHMEVKRGVLLMLLGGVHKKTIEVTYIPFRRML